MIGAALNAAGAMGELKSALSQLKSAGSSAQQSMQDKGNEDGEKAQLSFYACEVSEDKIEPKSGEEPFFQVQINPTKYHKDYQILYKHNKALGHIGSESKFVGIAPEKIRFEFTLDGTGVIGQDEAIEVDDMLVNLKKGLYDYDGENHEPNRVQILWGKLGFIGRLEAMSCEHVLFKPDGKPLRTNVKMSFVQCMSSKEMATRKKNSSPDLSHIIEVKAGDTLPLLCHKIYNNSHYYREVARFNNLAHSMAIEPGMKLTFPRLES